MTVNAAVGIGPAYDVDRLLTDILGIGELNTPDLAAPVLAPLTVGLENATIGLLVTCGAYYPDQEPMKETNDLSYRLLPRERDLALPIAACFPAQRTALAPAGLVGVGIRAHGAAGVIFAAVQPFRRDRRRFLHPHQH